MRFRTTWAAGILSTALWLTNVLFPQAPLKLITGAVHLPWIDKPEETTTALGKALGR